MLIVPESLTITRAKHATKSLIKATHKWLGNEKRKEGIHVSDLMDPRQAYWQRRKPKALTDKLAVMFLIGKVLHAFVLAAVDKVKSKAKEDQLASDEGSKYSEELEIWYSMDKSINGIPRELKTTRSYYVPKTKKDLDMYCEQLMCYMVCEWSRLGQLWLLMLNIKDKITGRTAPGYECFTIEVTEADLKVYKKRMIQVRDRLLKALKRKDPAGLPLCRRFKCGEGNCEWWKDCKPEGRYGRDKQKDWTDTERDLVVR